MRRSAKRRAAGAVAAAARPGGGATGCGSCSAPVTAVASSSCSLFIAATAALPGLVLVGMLRHAAPLAARWTGGLAGLASLAVGALGAQFVCANDAAGHQFLRHFMPVVLLALAGAAAGSSLFGRPHRPSA